MHDVVHSTNDCHAQSDAAQEAFEAAGGLEGKGVGQFHDAVRSSGYKYGGYFIQADGSRTYAYDDPKTKRGCTIHVTRWDGTAQGLIDNAAEQERQRNRIIGRSLL